MDSEHNVEPTLNFIRNHINKVDTILYIRYGRVEYIHLRSPNGKRTIWGIIDPTLHDDILELILNKRVMKDSFIAVEKNPPDKYDYLIKSWSRETAKGVYNFCKMHLTVKEGSTLIVGINTTNNEFWCIDDVWKSEQDSQWNNKCHYELIKRYCSIKEIKSLKPI